MTEHEQIMSAADAYAKSALDDGDIGHFEFSDHTVSLRDALCALIQSMLDDRERALSQFRIRQQGGLL